MACYAESRGVGADAEREHQNRGERRILARRAHGVANVKADIIEKSHDIRSVDSSLY